VLRLLAAGEVPPAGAARGVDVLLQVATAMAAEYSTRNEAAGEQDEATLAASLGSADAVRHPGWPPSASAE
jgi:hypothetical protein